MAYKCDNCEKGIMWGHRVSHSKRRTNHVFKPNLQRKTLIVDGRNVKVRLCTSCIKLMQKNTRDAARAAKEVAEATATV